MQSAALTRFGMRERMAKLTLWSPFAGLFVLIGSMAILARSADGRPHFMGFALVVVACWVIWGSGLVLGIWALRQRRAERPKGILGRAIFGIGFNALLICATAALTLFAFSKLHEANSARDEAAEKEAEEVRKRVGGGEALEKQLSSYADMSFAGRVAELQRTYQNAAKGLTNPPVLEMSSVKSTNDLSAREEVILEFVTASRELLNFSKNASEIYREELSKHKLSSQAREAQLKQFEASTHDLNPTIVELREADVRRGEAMLRIIRLLEANWGKWEYKPAAKGVEFQTAGAAKDYSNATELLDNTTAEALSLQQRLVKMRKGTRRDAGPGRE
jgi:hypothetical protein